MKRINQKLRLSKRTISALNEMQMSFLVGGASCPATADAACGTGGGGGGGTGFSATLCTGTDRGAQKC